MSTYLSSGTMDFLALGSPDSASDQRPKSRRTTIACRRCRRLRVKCRHIDTRTFCESCRQAGHECIFPQPGEPDFDRTYRHERRRKRPNPAHETSMEPASQATRAQSNTNTQEVSSRAIELQNQAEDIMSLATYEMLDSGGNTLAPKVGWDLLPPYEEVLEGCQIFITSYFQLGFLPKISFFERLHKHREDISVFLLLSILSISARFTPSLVRRYGDSKKATNFFLEGAATMVLDHMYKPSLEAIQAFFLMSLAEWGRGDRDRSSTHIGIAVRMAGTLRLHKEEAYYLPTNATTEEIVESEVARRTFWMLENHDNLHSGFNSPVSFSLSDITTLLPCEEREFAFGMFPTERSALMGTTPALKDDRLTKSSSRSLFATLIQSHNLWGQIARRVARNEVDQQGSTRPEVDTTLSEGEYTQLSTMLRDFEEHLPRGHRWSVWNLRGFKAEGLDLAYLSVVMMIRLSNIILRRSRVHTLDDGTTMEASHSADAASLGSASGRGKTITEELFINMVALHEQIEAYFGLRSPDQGFPAFVVFCIYICGSLANHLLKGESHFRTVTDAKSRAAQILETSTKLLSDIQDAWPMAKRWNDALTKAYQRHVLTRSTSTHVAKSRLVSTACHATRRHGYNEHSNSDHTSPAGRSLSAISVFHADQSTLFNLPEISTTDITMDDMSRSHDPWNDRISGMSSADNLDSELAFYLWPGGDTW